MERWRKIQEQWGNAQPDDQPQALAVGGAHGPVVHAVNRVAHLSGVTTGARVVDMRALCPQLRVDYADCEGDRAALERLALWARRWCPWTAADDWTAEVVSGGHGLVLDTTGSDHLWRGETKMLTQMEADLSMLGFSSRLAVAPSWGAAWALARFGPVRAICHDLADLAPLPVVALRLDAETVLLLNRLGLRSIGSLADLPRLSLARRFSRAGPAQNPLIRLDQMTGHLPEPVSPPDMPPVFRADAKLAEPILDPTHHLPSLCAELCGRMAQAHQGARRLRLTVYRTDGEISRIEVACALPSREPAHLAFLFRDRLERINPGFGFDLISLEAPATEPLGLQQVDLAGGSEAGLEISHLVDRLTARFGRTTLAQLRPVASHIPERAEARGAPMIDAPGQTYPVSERPQRLLDHPEEVRVLYAMPEGPPAQFQWRRRGYRVTRYQGPERIAPEWWQDKSGTRLRDYFKVEDEEGHRFWLYREGLQGDGRGGAPRWFLHGIFA
ncbi:Y-family DNA polymerase [Tabrizicola fusiformis]|uniref:Y-family DNA polymerase n=1 Tax=Tabrizicola sp. SY72 TaxID=2741673 RepID=UPI001572BFB2|nr:DNA polymerase Y family protein [Tabrizicola sp. SY72]NTT88136.1 DNA polymerase Y family protein [Tabrizicola sp. SY72]